MKTLPVSSIEFDKIYRVKDKRESLGYSDSHLSFLLGYGKDYIKKIEDPTSSLRYTAKETNYLLQIFDCTLPEIMAPTIKSAFYQLGIETETFGAVRHYKVYKEDENKDLVFFKDIKTTDPVFVNENAPGKNEVFAFVKERFTAGFFSTGKTALEVFKHCKAHLAATVYIDDVMEAIFFYTAKRKAPRLIRGKNEVKRAIFISE